MLLKLKEFYNTYQYFYFKFWTLHILVLVSLFTLEFKYVLYSIGIYMLYMPLLMVIHHDYISHEYVKPKNQWIDLLCLIISYTTEVDVKGKKDFHTEHHKTWKYSNQDPTQRKMKNVPIWRYVFGFLKPVAFKVPPIKCNILTESRWAKHLDRHCRKIYWAYVVICLIILPWPWFVVVCIYTPWLGAILFNLHDHIYHGNIIAKDRNWLLLLYSSAAWHVKHHEHYRSWYHGPGIWKWLNLSWYYQLALFNFAPSKIK